MIEDQKLRDMRRAVAAIGYYIPNDNPQWLGSGFLVEDGSTVITCAHVVGDGKGEYFHSLKKYRIINGKKCELSCWIFINRELKQFFIRLPVLSIAVFNKLEIGSSYYGEIPDVAILKIDNSQWVKEFGIIPLPVLEISPEISRKVGLEAIIIGYPSTTLLMYSQSPTKFNCLEPLAQFCRLAGVLPFESCPLPHFLAFDTIFAKGSSGSPICDAENGRVIAMVSELHPFQLPLINNDGDIIGHADVPSSIGFGVPSYFFYGMSKLDDGSGRFKI